MNSRQSGDSQETAAAKAGISARTGRRIDKGEHKPPPERTWRTREDPFSDVWDTEIVPLLEREPSLTALTLWEWLDDNYPSRYPERLLRTLQRRVKQWRATQGPKKPVMFRQSVPPGHQGLSDFTHPDTPITIAGKPFKHLLYQFRLAFSGWRNVHIVQGGESYSALADGLQSSLQRLGAAPHEHRTDSLSAAYTTDPQKVQLTKSYNALCKHYAMRPTTNNTGVSHENGAIEAPHGTLKRRIKQQVALRGTSDFSSIASYQKFLDDISDRLNRRCKDRLATEMAHLRVLPANKVIAYTRISVTVTTSSTIRVKRGLYTVPSSLIGERLNVHLYHDRLLCYYGQKLLITLPRVYPEKPEGRARLINYKHIIHSLAAKPQAFRFSQLRDDILPSDQYHQLWALAEQQFTPRDACKWIVSVLRIAHEYDCEGSIAFELLEQVHIKQQLPTLKQLQQRYLDGIKKPDIPVRQHDTSDYDELLDGEWAAGNVNNG
jgi:hypothetical protein